MVMVPTPKSLSGSIHCWKIGATAAFFEITKHNLDLRGFHLLWQIAAGTGATVMMIVILASLLSVRKVLVLEPAVVFRG